jgi:malonyl-CoA/methylmalonyl-CoA synthetase
MNVAKILSERARERLDKPAIVFEERVYTFGEIDSRVNAYAAMLTKMGVTKGDRVAIQLPKQMEFIFLHLAVLSVGATCLPLNVDYRAEEVEYFLTDSESSLVFTDHARYQISKHLIERIDVLNTVLVDEGESTSVRSLRTELAAADKRFERSYPTGRDDVAVICYTSGTTGRSKGAMLTHGNLVSNMLDLHQIWGWSDRDVLLHVLPLFHVHGLFVALHGGLNAGATIIMHEKFNPLRTWQTIESAKCSVLMGVPTVYGRLINQWDEMETKPNLSSMRVFISGSAPLMENQFYRFEQETGFRILERYGMTEAGMITSNPLDPSRRIAKSVGYPLPGVEIRVVDAEGNDLPSGEVGEVVMRGPNVFKGYWGMAEKTRESFIEGWFKSGDLGYLDWEDDRRLYLVGREKELIITGGYNVYPKEIENVLDTHEAIGESAVIGLPDEDFGERVTAVIALKEPGMEISAEAVIDFCKAHVAGYKCPKEVFVVEELPRNAMGKLQKNALVERFRKT